MVDRYRVDESTGTSHGPDTVLVEEPLEIRLDGELVATTMRTPGHDFELAVGFCHGEGWLAGARVSAVRYCATGGALETAYNIVTIETTGGDRHADAAARQRDVLVRVVRHRFSRCARRPAIAPHAGRTRS